MAEVTDKNKKLFYSLLYNISTTSLNIFLAGDNTDFALGLPTSKTYGSITGIYVPYDGIVQKVQIPIDPRRSNGWLIDGAKQLWSTGLGNISSTLKWTKYDVGPWDDITSSKYSLFLIQNKKLYFIGSNETYIGFATAGSVDTITKVNDLDWKSIDYKDTYNAFSFADAGCVIAVTDNNLIYVSGDTTTTFGLTTSTNEHANNNAGVVQGLQPFLSDVVWTDVRSEHCNLYMKDTIGNHYIAGVISQTCRYVLGESNQRYYQMFPDSFTDLVILRNGYIFKYSTGDIFYIGYISNAHSTAGNKNWSFIPIQLNSFPPNVTNTTNYKLVGGYNALYLIDYDNNVVWGTGVVLGVDSTNWVQIDTQSADVNIFGYANELIITPSV